ncbi:UDP-N-acetylglucosamine transferase subunit [Microbotryomycetes sp. JL201]|nr:UDP-N-acetylglucosamine transferase subunit [Microbotryomycetes sp. JL201]
MLRLARAIHWQRYSTRRYIISSGDALSRQKALELEREIGTGTFTIHVIPRARKVHQSYHTSVFTTIWSLTTCLWLISIRPLVANKSCKFADVVLLNGPGSCVPIVVAAFLPRVLGLPFTKLVYIESFARTKKLSMSAKLVRPFVDRFFVQWESLKQALSDDEPQRKSDEPSAGSSRWRLQARVEYQGWLV